MTKYRTWENLSYAIFIYNDRANTCDILNALYEIHFTWHSCMHFGTSSNGSTRCVTIVTDRRQETCTSIYATFVRRFARRCRIVSEREHTCIFRKKRTRPVVTGPCHDDVAAFPAGTSARFQQRDINLPRVYVTASLSRVEKRMEKIRKEREDGREEISALYVTCICRNYAYTTHIWQNCTLHVIDVKLNIYNIKTMKYYEFMSFDFVYKTRRYKYS